MKQLDFIVNRRLRNGLTSFCPPFIGNLKLVPLLNAQEFRRTVHDWSNCLFLIDVTHPARLTLDVLFVASLRAELLQLFPVDMGQMNFDRKFLCIVKNHTLQHTFSNCDLSLSIICAEAKRQPSIFARKNCLQARSRTMHHLWYFNEFSWDTIRTPLLHSFQMDKILVAWGAPVKIWSNLQFQMKYSCSWAS